MNRYSKDILIAVKGKNIMRKLIKITGIQFSGPVKLVCEVERQAQHGPGEAMLDLL